MPNNCKLIGMRQFFLWYPLATCRPHLACRVRHCVANALGGNNECKDYNLESSNLYFPANENTHSDCKVDEDHPSEECEVTGNNRAKLALDPLDARFPGHKVDPNVGQPPDELAPPLDKLFFVQVRLRHFRLVLLQVLLG